MDIIETAKNADNCKTLVKAIHEAGLEETLQGPGPFTVFAPTDQAFEALPEGTLDDLLEDQERLKAVLTYHVVQGRHDARALNDVPRAKSVQGSPLNIHTRDGVRVENARVTQPDIQADNGIIHLIDKVLIPPKEAAAGRRS